MRRRNFTYLLVAVVLVAAVVIAVVVTTRTRTKHKQEALAQSTQLWTCGMHPEVIVEEPGNCPKCGMKLVPLKTTAARTVAAETPAAAQPQAKERKILYWRAPMDPTEIYDHPGKSKMGMDLIPVYEGEATLGAGGTIRIDPATVQNMGVRTAPVRRTDFVRTIRTVGKVEYNEEALYVITTKISGWIEKLYVDYTGQEVRKGEPLLEIYSPEFVTAQEEYLLALKTQRMMRATTFESIRDGAESLLESTRKRLLYWDIPLSEIQRLEEGGKVRKTVQLQSPANGVVVQKSAVEGMYVKEGMSLYRIADLSTVWVQASIYDSEVPWVTLGQNAEMELSYLPGKIYKGRVTYVYPYLNEKARDVRIRLEFPNPGFALKPGMYANVRLRGEAIRKALVIPSEAVIRSGERNIVFVARGNGRFEPREVRIGEEGGSSNNSVRIVSGLLEGEQVVTSAQFLLDSESRLQEAIQKMLAEKMHAPRAESQSPSGRQEAHPTKVESAEMRMPQQGNGPAAPPTGHQHR